MNELRVQLLQDGTSIPENVALIELRCGQAKQHFRNPMDPKEAYLFTFLVATTSETIAFECFSKEHLSLGLATFEPDSIRSDGPTQTQIQVAGGTLSALFWFLDGASSLSLTPRSRISSERAMSLVSPPAPKLLFVTIFDGVDLPDREFENADGYFVVCVVNQLNIYGTSERKSSSPTWNETFSIRVNNESNEILHIFVCYGRIVDKYGAISDDQIVGHAQFEIEKMPVSVEQHLSVPCRKDINPGAPVPLSRIRFSIRAEAFGQPTAILSMLTLDLDQPVSENSWVVIEMLKSAFAESWVLPENDLQAHFSLGDKSCRSRVVPSKAMVEWNEFFKLMVDSESEPNAQIQFVQKSSSSSREKRAHLNIPIGRFQPALPQQLTMPLLADEEDPSSVCGEVELRLMTINFGASALPALSTVLIRLCYASLTGVSEGQNDICVVLSVGNTFMTSSSRRSSSSPNWEEEFEFPVSHKRSSNLTATICEIDKDSKRVEKGQCSVSLDGLIRNSQTDLCLPVTPSSDHTKPKETLLGGVLYLSATAKGFGLHPYRQRAQQTGQYVVASLESAEGLPLEDHVEVFAQLEIEDMHIRSKGQLGPNPMFSEAFHLPVYNSQEDKLLIKLFSYTFCNGALAFANAFLSLSDLPIGVPYNVSCPLSLLDFKTLQWSPEPRGCVRLILTAFHFATNQELMEREVLDVKVVDGSGIIAESASTPSSVYVQLMFSKLTFKTTARPANEATWNEHFQFPVVDNQSNLRVVLYRTRKPGMRVEDMGRASLRIDGLPIGVPKEVVVVAMTKSKKGTGWEDSGIRLTLMLEALKYRTTLNRLQNPSTTDEARRRIVGDPQQILNVALLSINNLQSLGTHSDLVLVFKHQSHAWKSQVFSTTSNLVCDESFWIPITDICYPLAIYLTRNSANEEVGRAKFKLDGMIPDSPENATFALEVRNKRGGKWEVPEDPVRVQVTLRLSNQISSTEEGFWKGSTFGSNLNVYISHVVIAGAMSLLGDCNLHVSVSLTGHSFNTTVKSSFSDLVWNESFAIPFPSEDAMVHLSIYNHGKVLAQGSVDCKNLSLIAERFAVPLLLQSEEKATLYMFMRRGFLQQKQNVAPNFTVNNLDIVMPDASFVKPQVRLSLNGDRQQFTLPSGYSFSESTAFVVPDSSKDTLHLELKCHQKGNNVELVGEYILHLSHLQIAVPRSCVAYIRLKGAEGAVAQVRFNVCATAAPFRSLVESGIPNLNVKLFRIENLPKYANGCEWKLCIEMSGQVFYSSPRPCDVNLQWDESFRFFAKSKADTCMLKLICTNEANEDIEVGSLNLPVDQLSLNEPRLFVRSFRFDSHSETSTDTNRAYVELCATGPPFFSEMRLQVKSVGLANVHTAVKLPSNLKILFRIGEVSAETTSKPTAPNMSWKEHFAFWIETQSAGHLNVIVLQEDDREVGRARVSLRDVSMDFIEEVTFPLVSKDDNGNWIPLAPPVPLSLSLFSRQVLQKELGTSSGKVLAVEVLQASKFLSSLLTNSSYLQLRVGDEYKNVSIPTIGTTAKEWKRCCTAIEVYDETLQTLDLTLVEKDLQHRTGAVLGKARVRLHSLTQDTRNEFQVDLKHQDSYGHWTSYDPPRLLNICLTPTFGRPIDARRSSQGVVAKGTSFHGRLLSAERLPSSAQEKRSFFVHINIGPVWFKSSCITTTSDPEWNEDFSLDLLDTQNDHFMLSLYESGVMDMLIGTTWVSTMGIPTSLWHEAVVPIPVKGESDTLVRLVLKKTAEASRVLSSLPSFTKAGKKRLLVELLRVTQPSLSDSSTSGQVYLQLLLGHQFCSTTLQKNRKLLFWGECFHVLVDNENAQTLDVDLIERNGNIDCAIGKCRMKLGNLEDSRTEMIVSFYQRASDGTWKIDNPPSQVFLALTPEFSNVSTSGASDKGRPASALSSVLKSDHSSERVPPLEPVGSGAAAIVGVSPRAANRLQNLKRYLVSVIGISASKTTLEAQNERLFSAALQNGAISFATRNHPLDLSWHEEFIFDFGTAADVPLHVTVFRHEQERQTKLIERDVCLLDVLEAGQAHVCVPIPMDSSTAFLHLAVDYMKQSVTFDAALDHHSALSSDWCVIQVDGAEPPLSRESSIFARFTLDGTQRRSSVVSSQERRNELLPAIRLAHHAKPDSCKVELVSASGDVVGVSQFSISDLAFNKSVDLQLPMANTEKLETANIVSRKLNLSVALWSQAELAGQPKADTKPPVVPEVLVTVTSVEAVITVPILSRALFYCTISASSENPGLSTRQICNASFLLEAGSKNKLPALRTLLSTEGIASTPMTLDENHGISTTTQTGPHLLWVNGFSVAQQISTTLTVSLFAKQRKADIMIGSCTVDLSNPTWTPFVPPTHQKLTLGSVKLSTSTAPRSSLPSPRPVPARQGTLKLTVGDTNCDAANKCRVIASSKYSSVSTTKCGPTWNETFEFVSFGFPSDPVTVELISNEDEKIVLGRATLLLSSPPINQRTETLISVPLQQPLDRNVSESSEDWYLPTENVRILNLRIQSKNCGLESAANTSHNSFASSFSSHQASVSVPAATPLPTLDLQRDETTERAQLQLECMAALSEAHASFIWSFTALNSRNQMCVMEQTRREGLLNEWLSSFFRLKLSALESLELQYRRGIKTEENHERQSILDSMMKSRRERFDHERETLSSALGETRRRIEASFELSHKVLFDAESEMRDKLNEQERTMRRVIAQNCGLRGATNNALAGSFAQSATPTAMREKSWEIVAADFISGMKFFPNAVALYEHSCQAVGAKPNSQARVYFSSLTVTPNYLWLTDIQFPGNYFGDKGTIGLATMFGHLPFLRSVNLRNTYLTTKGMEPLVTVLSRHPNFTSLDVRDNDTLYTKQDGKLLLLLALQNPRIVELWAEGTGIFVSTMQRIEEQCKTNRDQRMSQAPKDVSIMARFLARAQCLSG